MEDHGSIPLCTVSANGNELFFWLNQDFVDLQGGTVRDCGAAGAVLAVTVLLGPSFHIFETREQGMTKYRDTILKFFLGSATHARAKPYSTALWLLAVAFCLNCAVAAGAQAPKTLTIQEIEPMSIVGEPLYYRVVVAYPAAFQQGAFSFFVNGKPAPFRSIDEDSSAKESPRAFQVYLGEPRHKRVEVALTLGEQTVRAGTDIEFRSKGGMVMLGYYDGALLSMGSEEISVLAYFITNAQLKVNGSVVKTTIEPVPEMEGIFAIMCEPSESNFKPGVNLIEYSGTDREGQPFYGKVSIFVMYEGTVQVGDQFNYAYGRPKMNEAEPELCFHLVGDALAESSAWQEIPIYVMDGLSTPWLTRMTLFVQPIIARKVGTSTLEIVAEYSTGYKNKTDLAVTVKPDAP
jgi:hypothetical protein